MPSLDFDDSASNSFFQKGETLLQNNRWAVLASLVGLLFVGGGIFLLGSNLFEQPKVEVLGVASSSQSPSEQKIVVEISGNVETPGVYNLPKESFLLVLLQIFPWLLCAGLMDDQKCKDRAVLFPKLVFPAAWRQQLVLI